MALLNILGFTLDIIGKILLGVSVLMVHRRVMQEKKINTIIIKKMRQERLLVLAGLLLMVVGYLLQLPSKLG